MKDLLISKTCSTVQYILHESSYVSMLISTTIPLYTFKISELTECIFSIYTENSLYILYIF